MYQQNFPPFSTQKGEKTHLPCHSTPLLCPQTKKAVWDYSKTVATTELLLLKTQALCLQGPCSCTSNRRLPDRRGGLTSSFLSINERLLRVNTFLQKLSVITSMTEYHKKKKKPNIVSCSKPWISWILALSHVFVLACNGDNLGRERERGFKTVCTKI